MSATPKLFSQLISSALSASGLLLLKLLHASHIGTSLKSTTLLNSLPHFKHLNLASLPNLSTMSSSHSNLASFNADKYPLYCSTALCLADIYSTFVKIDLLSPAASFSQSLSLCNLLR